MKLDHVSLCTQRKIVLTLLVAVKMCEKNTRRAHGKLDDSLQESWSHIWLAIVLEYIGNKIQNGQIAWFIGYIY